MKVLGPLDCVKYVSEVNMLLKKQFHTFAHRIAFAQVGIEWF